MSILDNTALNSAARAKQKADAAYEKAFTNYINDHNELLPVKRFWDIMEYLRTQIIYSGRDSKYYCDELFRRCICSMINIGGQLVTLDELVLFCNNWDAVSHELHHTLFEVVEDKGDDGYGDLCDNLPLVGRAGVKKLLSFKPSKHTNDDVKDVIKDSTPSRSDSWPTFTYDKWTSFMWNGENYWSMTLRDEAKRRYVREACDHTPKKPKKVSLV